MNKIQYYRAKSAVDNNWHYGIVVAGAQVENGEKKDVIALFEQGKRMSAAINIQPKTLCRNIGLQDGNGNEIYEGDIVNCRVLRVGGQYSNWQRKTNINHGKCRVIPMEVYWEEPFDGYPTYYGGWRLRPTKKALELIEEYEKPIGAERSMQDINYYNIEKEDLLEVVGNIFDNKEYLE